jgi:hypothetical protein
MCTLYPKRTPADGPHPQPNACTYSVTIPRCGLGQAAVRIDPPPAGGPHPQPNPCTHPGCMFLAAAWDKPRSAFLTGGLISSSDPH